MASEEMKKAKETIALSYAQAFLSTVARTQAEKCFERCFAPSSGLFGEGRPKFRDSLTTSDKKCLEDCQVAFSATLREVSAAVAEFSKKQKMTDDTTNGEEEETKFE